MCAQAGAAGCPARVNGIGAREKYSAKPSRSTTTLVTFGFCSSAGSLDARAAACSSRAPASNANGSTAASIVSGASSGSSPWTLTTTSQVERGGDFGEAIGAALVRRRRHHRFTAEPAHRVEDASIVGRHDHPRRPSSPRRRAGRRARSSAGPPMSASALPGRRLDSYRAGMMATAETGIRKEEGPVLETGGTANITTTVPRKTRTC